METRVIHEEARFVGDIYVLTDGSSGAKLIALADDTYSDQLAEFSIAVAYDNVQYATDQLVKVLVAELYRKCAELDLVYDRDSLQNGSATQQMNGFDVEIAGDFTAKVNGRPHHDPTYPYKDILGEEPADTYIYLKIVLDELGHPFTLMVIADNEEAAAPLVQSLQDMQKN